jgi:hypothetical protein
MPNNHGYFTYTINSFILNITSKKKNIIKVLLYEKTKLIKITFKIIPLKNGIHTRLQKKHENLVKH